MARNLILSGGVGHPFAATSPMVADALEPAGIDSRIAEDPDAWLVALTAGTAYDLVTVNALRWRMLPERYAALRDEWAFSTPPALADALRGHVERGGGLLAVHTSCICFDDWDGWAELLGGTWDWDRSFHPVFGPPVHVEPAHTDASADAITGGIEPFAVRDEVYHQLRWTDGVEVLATATVAADAVPGNPPPAGAAGIGDPQPVLWRRRHGAGRVAVDTLGHDGDSLGHPSHRLLLRRVAAWAAGTDGTRRKGE